MLITPEYRTLNEQFHKERPDYGTSSGRWVDLVDRLASRCNITDILDYGCGKRLLAGGLIKKNPQYTIHEYDPAVLECSMLPKPADFVICTDVLEHIEPECIDDVLDHLVYLTRLTGFFTIATKPAKKQLPDGRNAHILLADSNWWLNELLHRFSIVSWNVMHAEIHCLVRKFIDEELN